MRIRDDSFAQRGALSLLRYIKTDIGGYLDGTVRTPHGIVEATSSAAPSMTYARLDFVWRGRHYMRTFHDKSFSRRGLAIVAARFARAITKGQTA